MTASQNVSDFFDCTGLSFRRTPESSKMEYLLDAGLRRHDGTLCFPGFCDAINNRLLYGSPSAWT
jgi:hypothetical protein